MHGSAAALCGSAAEPAGPPSRLREVRAAIASVKAHGLLELEFERRHARTILARDRQAGCLKVRGLAGSPTGTASYVVLNTAGGLTGGDRLDQTLVWRSNSRALATTPAAEKIYRSTGEHAVIHTRLKVEADARAEWLPQETILFNGSRLTRILDIELDAAASLVACDATVFGRLARNEQLTDGTLHDRLRVYRDGRLVLFDNTRVGGAIGDWLDRPGAGHGYRASGMVLVACNRPAERLQAIRNTTKTAAGLVGATLVRGLIHVRLLAASDAALRQDLVQTLAAARCGHPAPRSWSC